MRADEHYARPQIVFLCCHCVNAELNNLLARVI